MPGSVRKTLASVLLLLVLAAATAVMTAADTAAAGTADGEDHLTVFAGIEYAPVYDYAYYIARHPALKRRYGDNERAVLRYFVLHGYPKGEKASYTADAKAYAAVRKARIARFLKKTRTAARASQILVVCDHELSLWNRGARGEWKRKLVCYCGYGRNGLSADRTEGDQTTPIGSFPILHAFGRAANPGTRMTWRSITPYSYWSDEYETYNTWVESREWVSGEHLINYYQYAYAMAIGFNVEPAIYGRGSAIFLHCKSNSTWSSAGCVTVTTAMMKKLLRLCGDGTWIMIVPQDADLKQY